MAFKRYIHRHGKKLGPYYYENIRQPGGRIKTVYIGSNPSEHPRHRLKKPLVFLIAVLVLMLVLGGALFLLQNKAYLAQKVKVQEPDFDVDQILLKVLIKSNEFIEKQIRVINIGSSQIAVSGRVIGLEDIVSINPASFSIKPGQTKIVSLNFSSFISGQGIEQQPGVYVGKLAVNSEKATKEIPVVLEIETKNVLFDINLNPVAIERRIKQGAETTIEVRLFNLESIESENVDVEYFVKDMDGNTILTESETVVVKTQASFFKTISVPKNLKPGLYVFAAYIRLGSSVGTASYLFEVAGPEEASFAQFCTSSVLCLALSLATMLLLFVLTAYFYFFIGAYLYEKVTGFVAPPEKRGKPAVAKEKKEEAEKYGIFGRIKAGIGKWNQERKKKKAEREKEQAEKRGMELEEGLKELEIEKQLKYPKPELKEAKAPGRLDKFYELAEGLDDAVESGDIPKADILYAKAKESYEALEKLEQKEAHSRLTELFKKRDNLLEEAKQQENLREKEEKSAKEELERRQKELEKQKAIEERQRLEEEHEKQKDMESQRREQAKAQKLELRRQLEDKIIKNMEAIGKLNSEAKKLESGNIILSGRLNETDGRENHIENEIIGISKEIGEFIRQKHEMLERYKESLDKLGKEEINERDKRDSKIKELKSELESKKTDLAKQLEAELRKLSPAKRRKVEKWKRMELKAKLKIEEQGFEDEAKRYKSSTFDKRKEVEADYRKGLYAISKKQSGQKKVLADLQTQKRELLLEKGNITKSLENKDREIQKIRQKIALIEKDTERVKSELSKLGHQLEIRNFFRNLLPGYKKEDFETEARRLEKEKREEGQRKAQEEKKAKEELERGQKEIERQKALEEKQKLEDERRKEKEEIKKKELREQRAAERKKKFRDFFSKIGLRSMLEKKEQLELEKEQKDILEDLKRKEQEKKEETETKEDKKKKTTGKKKPKHEEEQVEEPEEKPILEAIEEKKPEKKKLFSGFAALFKKEPKFELKDDFEVAEEEKPAAEEQIISATADKEEEPAEKPKTAKKEKKTEKKKPKSEVEELEEAIRSLGLFKKIETGKIKPTGKLLEEKPSLLKRIFRKKEEAQEEAIEEAPAEEIKQEKPAVARESVFKRLFRKKEKVPEEILAETAEKAEGKPEEAKPEMAKSRNIEKCLNALNKTKEAIGKNNFSKAKKIYVEARELYIGLEDNEKKEVYDELMEMYNRLK
ncbi:hypothetical protein J4204_03655 [Candidatus Woesearchaeota archaeon]|nr:hypothetical protein [Candidatus Woesearchaeota archaeon]